MNGTTHRHDWHLDAVTYQLHVKAFCHCTDIHPSYGSLQDFTAFIDAAHALTLEMVTPEEREFMDGHYAKDARMRINVGIRRRLAPLMDNGRDETRQ